jgi:hypothetical protein
MMSEWIRNKVHGLSAKVSCGAIYFLDNANYIFVLYSGFIG